MTNVAVKLATLTGEKLVGRLVDTLYDNISGELSMLIGVREEVRYIIGELQIMSAFLREAEEKHANNDAVRAWVQQVRQLSYTVEDCIDEFSLHLEQHGSKNLKARHRIAAEIKSIKATVQEVSNRRLRYGIVDMNKASSSKDYNFAQYDPRLAALFIEEAQLVGIDVPRQKLVGWLMDDAERELSLIAVVGGGGLGKTTIVRKAYEDPTVKSGNFTCRAWITVSQIYRIEELLRDMIKQFNPARPKDLDKLGRQQLIAVLKDYLCNKRYIIVFDDIWNIDAWKSLYIALPNNDCRSRIMLTTRNNEVAEACCSQIRGLIYHPEKLSDMQSMDLFCRRVFNNHDNACPEELKKVSEDLLRKCDGLPLAIVSIAGVLASKSKKTIKEWEKFLGHLGSELEANPNLEGVKQILTLSYDDLPYHVKHCFLYLSKFPEDYIIDRKNIQSLWIVEGFVAGRRGMTEEEVAESYFNEIVNRFMILPLSFSIDGRVKSFGVHDIMLELLVSKSLEENFVTVVGKSSRCVQHDVNRRLSIHSSYSPTNVTESHLRSLSMFMGGITPISPSMRMLRVLDLGDIYDFGGNYSIENVGKFLHLKYLRLRMRSGIPRLPTSLGNLRNLETLDLRGSIEGRKIPSGVIKCQQLRVLRGSYMRVPRGIGRLRNLQELASVDAKRSSTDVAREIGKLTQLWKLSILKLPKKSFNDFDESLQTLSGSLRSLEVSYLGGRLSMNNLSSPPLLLERLKLQRCFDLPNWVGSLNKVVKVNLVYCVADDTAIEVLGSLPNLTNLSLEQCYYPEGRLFFGAGGFPSLKVLRLWSLKGAKSLSFEQGSMLHLESITLNNWPFPREEEREVEFLGIKNLPSLKEINIQTTLRESWEAVSADVAEHPNRPRVMFTTFLDYHIWWHS